MKAKRWRIVAGSLLVAAIFMVGYLVCRVDSEHHVSYNNFEKIQIGMRRNEVDELLGRPCQCEDGVVFITVCNYQGLPPPDSVWETEWTKIQLTLQDGVIVGKTFENKATSPSNLFAGLMRRLPRLTPSNEATFTDVSLSP